MRTRKQYLSSSKHLHCPQPYILPCFLPSFHKRTHSKRPDPWRFQVCKGKRMSTGKSSDFEAGGIFDLGHPLLNKIVHSFVKAAGIGALQSVSRQAYMVASEGGGDRSATPEIEGRPRRRFPDLSGDNYGKSLESLVKTTGKETFQWGLAAGMYSGLTHGLKEARGAHDWKNSAVAGAVTGATVALTSEDTSHEQVVQFAITGAAISAAANLLSGIF